MSSMAAREASSSRFSYHVFLSFRGEDTRNTFTDHLYTALVHAGIRTFRDDDELDRGVDIASELERAIQESRVSVIVFSKDYASSRWCLDELVKILERKNAAGHTVLPVFYHVNPSHVRKQKGTFAKSFAAHRKRCLTETKERKEEGMAKIKRWKAALREVADLAGMVLEDGYESSFIQEIVREIGNKLNRTVLHIGPYPVGLDARVKDINLWLQDGSDDVGLLTICGMGGIGKTTIAKTVYNLNFERFKCSCFLANIREISEQPNGLVCLQKRLLSYILRGRKEKITCVDEGIMKIKDAIGCKRVLLVLDDVDQLDQLNAVLMMREWFHSGSKIIITTRHEQLLKPHQLSKLHRVKKLNDDESLQLFSWHAFGQDHPIEEYMEQSKRAVEYCGGIPLALQISGSSLSGRPVDVWESALKKLEVIPDRQILKKLRVSFDSLPDDHDKNIFLDIACFFVRKDKDFVITVLDGWDSFTKVAIYNLIERCLLAIDEHNKLTMHQLLRDMAREIIRQESPRQPEKRSRLWHHNDSLDVLREKTGTETIEGLMLNLHMLKEDRPAKKFTAKRHHPDDSLDKSILLYECNSLKRRRLGFFSWLPMIYSSMEAFYTSNEVSLQTDAFSRMRSLRILLLNNVRLIGDYKQFPRKLRWLNWDGFPLKSIPDEFPLDRLIALDMRNSCLRQVWRGNRLLISLKILNLSHSHGLISIPDFSKFPNLERLILKDCINFLEVHESIRELRKLVLLNLKDCKSLRKLPTTIGQLKSLKKLIISGCSMLDNLPVELGELETLTVLHADEVPISHLPSKSGRVKSWRALLWSWVLKPVNCPKCIKFSLASLSQSLVTVSLAKCNLFDDAIPLDLSRLSSLQFLNLSENPICSLPESINDLQMLQDLWLDSCTRLQSLPELPESLVKLKAQNCTSLEKLINLPNLLKSLFLDVYGCDKLVEVQGLFKLEPIGSFETEMLNSLGLFNLESIRNTVVELFNRLTETKMKCPVQGLYEFGIFSTYIPGNEVAAGFSVKSMGTSISFNIPSLPNLKLRGLIVCYVYARCKDRKFAYFGDSKSGGSHWMYIKISNKTKGMKWVYSPTFLGIPGAKEDMTLLSHWNFGDQLEAGDELSISVNGWSLTFKMKGCGVSFVYDQQEERGMVSKSEEKEQSITTFAHYKNVIHNEVIQYQFGKQGEYFLSNPEFFMFKTGSSKVSEPRKILYEKLFDDSAGSTGSDHGEGRGDREEDDSGDDSNSYVDDIDDEEIEKEVEEMLASWSPD